MTTHDKDKIIAAAKEAGFPEWENTDDPEFLKVIEKLYVVAFQSGAASRDAEVARLKTVPMRYRRMAFNAQLQNEVAELVAALEKQVAHDKAVSYERCPDCDYGQKCSRESGCQGIKNHSPIANTALAKVRKP